MGSGCGIQLASGCGNQLGSDCDIFIIPICCRVFTLCKTVVFRKSSQVQEGVFLPHPSSPARRGSTSLLNPPLLRREDLKPGRLGLYSQTSSRPQGVARGYRRNRVAIVHAPVAPLRMEDCHSGVSADVCMRQRALGA